MVLFEKSPPKFSLNKKQKFKKVDGKKKKKEKGKKQHLFGKEKQKKKAPLFLSGGFSFCPLRRTAVGASIEV